MTDNNLFRKAVLNHKINQNYGTVFINTPSRYIIVVIGSSLLIGAVVLFVLFAEYSEKFIVAGYLDSSRGMVRIYPDKNGIIIKCNIQAGAHVSKGEELLQINTAYENRSEEILLQLKKRKTAVENDLQYRKTQVQKLKPLLQKNYISLNEYNQKQEEVTRLESNLSQIDMDIIHYHQNQSYVIRSPVNGIITSVIYKKGQYTNLSRPLVTILPENAKLQAKLFVPVKKSGFINQGNKVLIRYDAYPYAHFGSYKGRIEYISQSILTDDEEEKPVPVGQPYYKIIASLEKQSMTLYGREKNLQQGMTISAVIVGSRKKIWQWIFNPLNNAYGGLFS